MVDAPRYGCILTLICCFSLGCGGNTELAGPAGLCDGASGVRVIATDTTATWALPTTTAVLTASENEHQPTLIGFAADGKPFPVAAPAAAGGYPMAQGKSGVFVFDPSTKTILSTTKDSPVLSGVLRAWPTPPTIVAYTDAMDLVRVEPDSEQVSVLSSNLYAAPASVALDAKALVYSNDDGAVFRVDLESRTRTAVLPPAKYTKRFVALSRGELIFGEHGAGAGSGTRVVSEATGTLAMLEPWDEISALQVGPGGIYVSFRSGATGAVIRIAHGSVEQWRSQDPTYPSSLLAFDAGVAWLSRASCTPCESDVGPPHADVVVDCTE